MADIVTVPWGLLHKLVDEEKIVKDKETGYKDQLPTDYKTRDNGYYFYNTFGEKVTWNANTMNSIVPEKAKELINQGKFYITLASFESDIPRCDYVPYEKAIARVTNLTVDNITIEKVHINVELWRDINGMITDDQLRAFRVVYDTREHFDEQGRLLTDDDSIQHRIMRIYLGYIRYISPKTYIKGYNRYRYL